MDGRAFAAVLLFVLLTAMTVKGQELPCTHRYILVPSTMRFEDCNVLGAVASMQCGVVGQPNDTLHVSWHRETDRAMAGNVGVPAIASGEFGYFIQEVPAPSLDIFDEFNETSTVLSTLTISGVNVTDLAYFWCSINVNGVTQPTTSEIILISTPCDPNASPCGAAQYETMSDICATDNASTQQLPDPPICPSQLPPLVSVTPTHSSQLPPLVSATPTHSSQHPPLVSATPTRSMVDVIPTSIHTQATPVASPGGPESDRSQIWKYPVIGAAGAIGVITAIVMLVILVFGVRACRRRPKYPVHISAYGQALQRERKAAIELEATAAAINHDTAREEGGVGYDGGGHKENLYENQYQNEV